MPSEEARAQVADIITSTLRCKAVHERGNCRGVSQAVEPAASIALKSRNHGRLDARSRLRLDVLQKLQEKSMCHAQAQVSRQTGSSDALALQHAHLQGTRMRLHAAACLRW